MNKVTQFISVFFHPLFMPLYATWLLLHSGSYLSYAVTPRLQQFLYIVIFVSTYLLPASIAWIMWQRGWIRNLEMEERSERTLPYFLTLCCYLAGVYLLFSLPVPRLFALTVLGAGLAILFAFLINLRWKISVHMIGIGGMMGLFYGYGRYFHLQSLWSLVLIALLAGILGSARLYRKAHSPAQVYAGFLCGFAIEFGFIYGIANFMLKG
ncbi:MAG: hypothetical protein JNL88_06555 [Bacteroidia bacterium]|nr:hypothetical protein [Bacteroidia bacterium]